MQFQYKCCHSGKLQETMARIDLSSQEVELLNNEALLVTPDTKLTSCVTFISVCTKETDVGLQGWTLRQEDGGRWRVNPRWDAGIKCVYNHDDQNTLCEILRKLKIYFNSYILPKTACSICFLFPSLGALYPKPGRSKFSGSRREGWSSLPLAALLVGKADSSWQHKQLPASVWKV